MNRLSEGIIARHINAFMVAKGFRIFTNDRKNYNLNIINIRSRSNKAGKFDDTQLVFWFYNNRFYKRVYDVTVDPGIPYLLKPLHPKGAAIVMPDQYDGIWRLGKHRGKYDALVQVGPINVLRDNNRNELIGDGNGVRMTGHFGINCHRASNIGISEWVGKYSAGCVVHKDPRQYDEFIKICKEAAINWENSFTATWITELDYDKFLINGKKHG